MFHSDYRFEAPTGGDLLAEIGLDPAAVREVAEHDRAMRCPDRGAGHPAYGFARLSPEPAFGHALGEAGPDEPRDPASSLPPAG